MEERSARRRVERWASVGRSTWYGDGAWGSEVCGLERCGGNATSVLGRWGKGEWRAGMREAGSRVVLAGKRGSSEGEQQWSTVVRPPSIRAWQARDGAAACH